MIYIGIDNGVTGAIAFVTDSSSSVTKTPVFSQQNYTKAKKNITRVDSAKLRAFLEDAIHSDSACKAYIERPLVNPGRFTSTLSAMRALEATQIVLEDLRIPYEFIDSKQWQRTMLPKGTTGSDELKKASFDRGMQIFPQHSDFIKSQKDADALLIAEFARRTRA